MKSPCSNEADRRTDSRQGRFHCVRWAAVNLLLILKPCVVVHLFCQGDRFQKGLQLQTGWMSQSVRLGWTDWSPWTLCRQKSPRVAGKQAGWLLCLLLISSSHSTRRPPGRPSFKYDKVTSGGATLTHKWRHWSGCHLLRGSSTKTGRQNCAWRWAAAAATSSRKVKTDVFNMWKRQTYVGQIWIWQERLVDL